MILHVCRAMLASGACALRMARAACPTQTPAAAAAAAAAAPARLQKFPHVQCFSMPHLAAVCISVFTSLLAMGGCRPRMADGSA